MRFSCFIIILPIALMLACPSSQAQVFLKEAEKSTSYLNQKIVHFENGDLLLGDSSIEPLENGAVDGEVLLTRLDECGNELWSNSYIIPEGYLEFRDFQVNEIDEIFVYGTYYIGLAEWVFLLKVDGETGATLDFRFLNTGTVDHFSYNMTLRNSKLLLYGLILDFGTQKQGFIARFDQNLNFEWGRKFEPFESTGNLIVLANDAVVGWSGDFIFKLNADGNTVWSFELYAGESIHPIGGPLEVPGGYIFECHGLGKSFFVMVDESGSIQWQSDEFEATNYGTAMTVLDNGKILCTYNVPDGDYNELTQSYLSTNGTLSETYELNLDRVKNTGEISQSFNPDSRLLSIAANTNPLSNSPVDIKDFILQFSIDNLNNDCSYAESISNNLNNNNTLQSLPLNFDIEDFEMTIEARPNLEPISSSVSFTDVCDPSPPIENISRDTFLECSESWLVFLPENYYRWLDFNLQNPRTITEPGVYKARKKDCTNPIEIEYTLTKDDCDCPVYIPNAFSPNNDGINDVFVISNDCNLEGFDLQIYTRWGGQIYKSNYSEQTWDGTFNGKVIQPGVYIVVLSYEYLNNTGNKTPKTVYQDLTILR